YLEDSYADTIWKKILDSNLRGSRDYRYSDLGFYMVAEIVKRLSGRRIDAFAADQFYKPLGLRSMTYNPLERFVEDRIPPTEEDRYFRWQRIQGYVHDMGAAMLGGVSGHAGLFSDAEDLAVLMQLLLNKGYYGGTWHLDPQTVRQFTSRCPKCTRRGIGFDMKQLDESIPLNVSARASDSTFGHLGFTGTCVWADPEHNLIYVFLSNRTYPSMRNNKLGKMDIRPRIQTAIYEAMVN
ncbi:MAG: serine hydrolase, partial [Phaeodactylibacter sp.]|nr:serine hydrolase [Phaeodactylibacter sp.]